MTWPYFAGVGLCAVILAWEHLHVRADDVGRINVAFANANMVMSLVFFAGVVVEVAVGHNIIIIPVRDAIWTMPP